MVDSVAGVNWALLDLNGIDTRTFDSRSLERTKRV